MGPGGGGGEDGKKGFQGDPPCIDNLVQKQLTHEIRVTRKMSDLFREHLVSKWL